MLPRKFFGSLDALMAILTHFEQFLRQILIFLPPTHESFKQAMIHFVRIFSIIMQYACLRRKDHCYQRGLKLRKNCTHQ